MKKIRDDRFETETNQLREENAKEDNHRRRRWRMRRQGSQGPGRDAESCRWHNYLEWTEWELGIDEGKPFEHNCKVCWSSEDFFGWALGRWRKWLVSLKEVRSVHMTRFVYSMITENFVSYTLYGLGDTSDLAYCAIVYLVCVTNRGRFEGLMASKTRHVWSWWLQGSQHSWRMQKRGSAVKAHDKQSTHVYKTALPLVLAQGGKRVKSVCTEQSERNFETEHQRDMKPLYKLRQSCWSRIMGCKSNDNDDHQAVWWQGTEWLNRGQEYWPSIWV